MQTMSKHFDVAMFEIYQRAKSEAGYNANIFLKMLSDRGGLDTAKYLINSPKNPMAIPRFTNEGGLI